MKMLVAAISVISAIVAILILNPIPGIAEPTHPNEVGLYTNQDGTGATGTFVVNDPVDVYLVLTRPADAENNDTPYATINAFECQLNFNQTGNLYKTREYFPDVAINFGDNTHLYQGFLEYIVVFADDIPVTEESVVLATFTFVHLDMGVVEVSLGPIGTPYFPGQMAFQSVENEKRIMYSVGGSHDAPVFMFNGEAVDVEKESFGSVKALYR